MTAAQLAPAPLLGQALPVELMNTVWADRHGVHDSLAALGDARRWLTTLAPRLTGPVLDSAEAGELSDGGLARLRDLRDALRRLAAERTGDPRTRAASATTALGAAIQTVNREVRAAQIWPALELTDDGAVTERSHTTGTPDDLLLCILATQSIDLLGRWNDLDLRPCLAPGCVLYFIKDHPRREWCSTACGNRARAARHYARHGRT